MALSDANEILLFEVFGLPRAGTAYEAQFVADWLRGPAGEAYDFSALTDQLEARLAVINADAALEARVAAVLADWPAPGEVEVYRQNGAAGILAHDGRLRQNIRDTLGNLIGFWAPDGGFVGEIKRRNGGGNRIVR
ncbi:MAG: hypothetical protein M5U26_08425 [Planctomycetota bacterium]|nr:hypothetical protein [Planctomycetota bacterium]